MFSDNNGSSFLFTSAPSSWTFVSRKSAETEMNQQELEPEVIEEIYKILIHIWNLNFHSIKAKIV